MSEGGKDKEAFQPKLSHLGFALPRAGLRTSQGWAPHLGLLGVLVNEGQVRHSQSCAQGQSGNASGLKVKDLT